MKCRRIVFWQEAPSPHQAPWIRALAGLLPAGEVVGVFQRELAPFRLAMGWIPPEYGQAQVFVAPDRATIDRLLGDDCERVVHVFSSMVHNPGVNAIFRQALSSRAIVGVLSEARNWRGWKGVLRQAHSLFHEHSYRRRVDFVLAMGRVGIRWFTKCGYDPAKLFPFCYVVEKQQCENCQSHVNSNVVIASVGRFLSWKRIDLLLKAVAEIPSHGWTLKIIGDGELRPLLETMARDLGRREEVAFKGRMSNDRVRQELALSDLFVLPSQFDGWGAVVNEALMSGVPVICSDNCGSADLIRAGLNGELFQSGSVSSLAHVLNRWIVKGPLPVSEREKIRHWSRCIEGESVAQYFMEIVEYQEKARSADRPRAPWESHD
ncbi:MAG: glycosyltransferase [Syntrophobacteraceae bacterium]